VHDGGLTATARDVARFGQMLLDGGSVGGHQVAPRRWLAEVWAADRDVRQAFAASPAEVSLPGGWYRNQFWVAPGPRGDLLLCLGIYGQLVRVDPATRTVMVKLSSWDAPQDPAHLFDTMLACDAVADALSGRGGRRGPRYGPTPDRSVLTGRVMGAAGGAALGETPSPGAG
jgi:CubicO group peptidase (beta-lactamase class C family)